MGDVTIACTHCAAVFSGDVKTAVRQRHEHECPPPEQPTHQPKHLREP